VKKRKKKEAHVPPLFFAVFTRRRIDLNSQLILKKVINISPSTQFLFIVKFGMFSIKVG